MRTSLLQLLILLFCCSCSRIDSQYTYFDPSKVKVGDKIAGLTLSSIKYDAEKKTVEAYFTGEKMISGDYFTNRGIYFTLDVSSSKLPKATYDEIQNNGFRLKGSSLFGSGAAEIVIKDYKIHIDKNGRMHEAVFVKQIEY